MKELKCLAVEVFKYRIINDMTFDKVRELFNLTTYELFELEKMIYENEQQVEDLIKLSYIHTPNCDKRMIRNEFFKRIGTINAYFTYKIIIDEKINSADYNTILGKTKARISSMKKQLQNYDDVYETIRQYAAKSNINLFEKSNYTDEEIVKFIVANKATRKEAAKHFQISIKTVREKVNNHISKNSKILPFVYQKRK